MSAHLLYQVQTFCKILKAASRADIMKITFVSFVCVEILQPSQPNGVMSSAVSLPNNTLLSPLSC